MPDQDLERRVAEQLAKEAAPPPAPPAETWNPLAEIVRRITETVTPAWATEPTPEQVAAKQERDKRLEWTQEAEHATAPAWQKILRNLSETAWGTAEGALGASDELYGGHGPVSARKAGNLIGEAGLDVLGAAAPIAGAGRALNGGMFSRVDDIVSQIPAKGIHPNRLAAQFKSGASAEELAHRGVPEFLATQGQQITPEAIIKHLAENPAPFPEVKKRGANLPDKPKWNRSDLVLGGGENYQETLLQAPTRKAKQGLHNVTIYEEGPGGIRSRRGDYDNVPAAEVERLKQYYGPPYEVVAEEIETPIAGSNMFTAGHWEEPNVLAHVRHTERTLPTGERGRFLEEVQSDWHQQGKEHGYATPVDEDEIDRLWGERQAAGERADEAQNALDEFHRSADPSLSYQERDEQAEPFHQTLRDALAEWAAAGDRVNQAKAKGQGVPDAPFKESWPDLALKQQLVEAADDPNVSWLGFTEGKTQGDRYNLRKQIDELKWFRDGDGYRISARKGGDIVAQKSAMNEKELASTVGKEMARKIVAEPEQTGLYSGIDLEIGGEGMTQFYDELLPKRLEKIAKTFGGKVERAPVSAELKEMDLDVPGFSVRDGDGNIRGIWEDRAQAEAYLANPPEWLNTTGAEIIPAQTIRTRKEHRGVPAWIVRLTPEMKAKIKAGLPLMGAAAAVAADEEQQ